VLFYAGVPYLFLVALFGAMQRSMIYFPSKTGAITPEQARLLPGRVRAIALETDDGLTLNGWHFLAEDRMAAGRESLGSLADMGLDVFLFDYRGYGDNPGSPSEEKLAADARSVWRYATETCRVPPERILLYGESLGGAVATRLAAELCEAGTPPAALVLCATFPSLVDVGAWHYPWLPVRLVLLDRYPSQARIASVTCPVLQVHGTDDDIVPLELARKLFAATPERSADGIAKRFVEVPDVGHNDIGVSNFRAAIGEMLGRIAN
jgi:hypothetical protein